MPTTQRRLIQDLRGCKREVEWEVDLDVLSRTQPWARDRACVERELRVMAEMYPAWIMTLCAGDQPVTRKNCRDIAVPAGGQWRWASDGSLISSMTLTLAQRLAEFMNLNYDNREPTAGAALCWEGLLPAPLVGLSRASRKLRGRYPVEIVAGSEWTAVPVRAIYCAKFPQAEPAVYYDSQWLHILQLPLSGHVHVFASGQMCLFYPGQWKRSYTVADVISQRVVNHVYSMLKIANGQPPDKAFIGRIHNHEWRPGA